MRVVLGCAALAIAASSSAAGAAEPFLLSLQKKGPWVADYDVDSCRLAAKFGTGEQEIMLLLARFSPGDEFQLSLAGRPLKRGESEVLLKIGFGPNQTLREVWALTGTLGDKPLLLLGVQRLDGWEAPKREGFVTPPAISPEQEEQVANLTLQLNRARAYRLELGSMRKPMAELRKCMNTLLNYWGYDPQVDAALTKRVVPVEAPSTWIRSADYPSKALRKGLQGIVQFRLDVSEGGLVTGCRILARTSPDEFADETCRLLTRRARFEPALDATGKPVKSYYVNRVRFLFGS